MRRWRRGRIATRLAVLVTAAFSATVDVWAAVPASASVEARVEPAAVRERPPRAEATTADPWADASGRELMQAVRERHHRVPYVYEEQSMILVDAAGHRETRRARRYTRLDEGVRFLLLLDAPREVAGVGLLAVQEAGSSLEQSVYLPALRAEPLRVAGRAGEGSFLGTDFDVASLTGPDLDAHRYVRRRDVRLAGQRHYRIDAYPRDADPARSRPVRRHYVVPDGLFVVRTDHLDEQGRVRKRQTFHDLRAVEGDMWRADLIMMEDLERRHRTLLKIHRRVFSPDYVPPEVFDAEWLARQHPPATADEAAQVEGGSVDGAAEPAPVPGDRP